MSPGPRARVPGRPVAPTTQKKNLFLLKTELKEKARSQTQKIGLGKPATRWLMHMIMDQKTLPG